MKQRIYLAAGLLLSLSVTAYGQDVFTDSIVVRGEAVSDVAPDAVVWVVSLEREAGSRERALASLDKETKAVREIGLAIELRESDLTVSRSRVRRSDGRYAAWRTVTLSQKKLADATVLMNRLNARRPANLSYRLEQLHREQLEHETQREAVANARLQATAIAQELGATLGRVVVVENEFGEAGAFGSRPRFSTYKAMPLEYVSAETFTSTKIRVHASVFVTYSIGATVD